MNPQPDISQVVAVQQYYTSLKLDSSYKKKVTWLGEGGLQSTLALVEYVGKFPGLSSHGNARQKREFLRTPSYVMEEVADLLKLNKPKQVYIYSALFSNLNQYLTKSSMIILNIERN